jgi:hypothetical protein
VISVARPVVSTDVCLAGPGRRCGR